jgi:hypothetical protein
MYRFLRRGGDEGDEEKVDIRRAENGYIVTMYPVDESMDYPHPGRLTPEDFEEMKAAREKSRPRVFVFADIDKALDAVKEFLLDGRIPKKDP